MLWERIHILARSFWYHTVCHEDATVAHQLLGHSYLYNLRLLRSYFPADSLRSQTCNRTSLACATVFCYVFGLAELRLFCCPVRYMSWVKSANSSVMIRKGRARLCVCCSTPPTLHTTHLFIACASDIYMWNKSIAESCALMFCAFCDNFRSKTFARFRHDPHLRLIEDSVLGVFVLYAPAFVSQLRVEEFFFCLSVPLLIPQLITSQCARWWQLMGGHLGTLSGFSICDIPVSFILLMLIVLQYEILESHLIIFSFPTLLLALDAFSVMIMCNASFWVTVVSMFATSRVLRVGKLLVRTWEVFLWRSGRWGLKGKRSQVHGKGCCSR